MTTTPTTPTKPSERIRQLAALLPADTVPVYSERLTVAILTYLDEREDSVHPIARARMATPEDEAWRWPGGILPEKLRPVAARRDGIPCLCKSGSDRVQNGEAHAAHCPIAKLAHPAPTSSPGDDNPGMANCGHGYAPGSTCCPQCHPTAENVTYLANQRDRWKAAAMRYKLQRDEARRDSRAGQVMPSTAESFQTEQPNHPTYRNERDAAREELLWAWGELERVRAELSNVNASLSRYTNLAAERGVQADELQAELARVRAENARLTGEPAESSRKAKLWERNFEGRTERANELQTKLTDSEQARENLHKCISEAGERHDAEVSELRAEIADSEAKRTQLSANVLTLLAQTGPRFPLYCAYCNGSASPVDHQSEHHRQWLEWKAGVFAPDISALDQPPQVDAGRAIVVGSKWKRLRDGYVVRVTGIVVLRECLIDYASDDNNVAGRDLPDRFRREHTWLSDPPVSESEGSSK
jgi:hypothetical protein